MTARKATSPFDAAATERQRRMGLIDDDGKANGGAVSIVARACAGMFFDDLCDYGGEDGMMLSTYARLSRLRETAEARQVFLSICVAYDEMRRPLPELLWWISGSNEIVPLFIESFMDSLKTILCKIQNGGGTPA